MGGGHSLPWLVPQRGPLSDRGMAEGEGAVEGSRPMSARLERLAAPKRVTPKRAPSPSPRVGERPASAGPSRARAPLVVAPSRYMQAAEKAARPKREEPSRGGAEKEAGPAWVSITAKPRPPLKPVPGNVQARREPRARKQEVGASEEVNPEAEQAADVGVGGRGGERPATGLRGPTPRVAAAAEGMRRGKGKERPVPAVRAEDFPVPGGGEEGLDEEGLKALHAQRVEAAFEVVQSLERDARRLERERAREEEEAAAAIAVAALDLEDESDGDEVGEDMNEGDNEGEREGAAPPSSSPSSPSSSPGRAGRRRPSPSPRGVGMDAASGEELLVAHNRMLQVAHASNMLGAAARGQRRSAESQLSLAAEFILEQQVLVAELEDEVDDRAHRLACWHAARACRLPPSRGGGLRIDEATHAQYLAAARNLLALMRRKAEEVPLVGGALVSDGLPREADLGDDESQALAQARAQNFVMAQAVARVADALAVCEREVAALRGPAAEIAEVAAQVKTVRESARDAEREAREAVEMLEEAGVMEASLRLHATQLRRLHAHS